MQPNGTEEITDSHVASDVGASTAGDFSGGGGGGGIWGQDRLGRYVTAYVLRL